MKRLLALAGACVLVAAAVVVRGAIDDDDSPDADDGPSGDGAFIVACIRELEDACRALGRDVELRIEDPGATIAYLVDGNEIDAWVTLDPWPEIAAFTEDRELFGESVAVAGSDLVVLARSNRIPRSCPDPFTWTCLVDELGDEVAVPDVDSALGRLVLGHAAVDFFGGAPASNDFADPDLARRLGRLDTALDDPIDEIRVGLPQPVATGTARGDLVRLGTRATAFSLSRGATPASVAVVVTGSDADRVAGEPGFTRGLELLGWTLDAAAATTGLPDPGVLFALAQEVGS